MPAYPCNFMFNANDHILSWDGVPKADEYEIVFSISPYTSWNVCYSGGNDTSTPFSPQPGKIKTKGRTKQGTLWSNYCPDETLTIP